MDFSSRNVETGFQHLCESVFVRLCQIVGTSVQVAIRRETENISEMLRRQVAENDDVIVIMSGSMREGFRLESSDLDFMDWLNDHRVIWDMCQSEYHYTESKTLILSYSSESPPGFTLLELLTPTTDREVRSACVPMNDRLYISSSLYRQQTQTHMYPGSTEHGPCESGEILGRLEYDFARCFACDFWPPSASSWINRCHSWPEREIVDDIIRNGCHFVPIGNPLGLHEHEEWRISFSVAEHKLVHTMNHCQFLTYGLLKIFLKEVMDKQSAETNKLLCSYHMKTAVFWVIQQNIVSLWCPKTLLVGFWVCFKLLLKWVYKGVCPNFFIPQNNLFLTKIHGSAQRSLFLQLHGLYEKGLACLLQSPSIRSYITDVLYNPRVSICTNEDRMKSECEYDVELFNEIARNVSQAPQNQDHCIKYLQALELMIGLPLTQNQVLVLQKFTATILQSTAFTLRNSDFYISNKHSEMFSGLSL
ncbi:cyclic GMP-AMP synthase-like receptor 2 [Crassostrea virginica]